MTWKLFLDDGLADQVPSGWTHARTVDEAITLVRSRGLPVAISLDHDLGQTYPTGPAEGPLLYRITGHFRPAVNVHPTGLDFVGWLWDLIEHGEYAFPEGFTYYVHSANPRGRAMMACIMEKLTGQPPNGWQDWWRKA